VTNVIELRRSGNLQVSIDMAKCINGRRKPFRCGLLKRGFHCPDFERIIKVA
jgi:hypothetical protein